MPPNVRIPSAVVPFLSCPDSLPHDVADGRPALVDKFVLQRIAKCGATGHFGKYRTHGGGVLASLLAYQCAQATWSSRNDVVSIGPATWRMPS